jgi:CheY-like chemotaxis protein
MQPATSSGTHAIARRVLIVDDSPDTRAIYRGLFGAEGFHVEEAGNGAAAIASAVLCRPDVIVLDHQMPVMSGAEALNALARDPRTRNIPVVLVTACLDLVPLEVRVLTAACLSKPCETDDLTGIVRALAPRGASAASKRTASESRRVRPDTVASLEPGCPVLRRDSPVGLERSARYSLTVSSASFISAIRPARRRSP